MTTILQDSITIPSLGVCPEVRWEHVSCNLCNSDDTQLYHRERIGYFDKILDFTIVRCRRCGLVYTNPRLADHNATYLLGSRSEPQLIERHGWLKAGVYERALNEIQCRLGRQGINQRMKLLDLGCGSGHFLAAAKERGFEIRGLEPASVPAEYAQKRFGLPVIRRDIYDADLPENSFDVITAWDVIEHVSDPQEMLRQCTRWLKDDGIMALRFPSASWQKVKGIILHRILADRRAAFSPTMHLYFFSSRTFAQMADRVKLEVLKVKNTAVEMNDASIILNGVKLAGGAVLRGIEMVSGKHLGNLEVYCRKARPGWQNHTED